MTTAEEKVNLPGIALIVVGVLTILVSLGRVAMSVLSLIPSLIDVSSEGGGAIVAFMIGAGLSMVLALVGAALSILAGAIIAFGGVKMRSLQSAGVVYAGAIVAMIPCCAGPCCCLGLPIGIWAIVTMQDEEVKSAFEG